MTKVFELYKMGETTELSKKSLAEVGDYVLKLTDNAMTQG